MRWLMQLLNRQQTEDTPSRHDTVHSAPVIEEHTRAYQSDKLAVVEAEVKRMAQLQRLGYDLDTTTRQESDAGQ